MDFLSGTIIAGGGIAFGVAILVLGASRSGQGATFRDRIFSSPALSPLLIIHYFLPYALIVLIFFMDIMSQLPQGIWSLVFGFAAFVLNYVFGHDTTILPNDLCEIPGLKGMSSSLMPQSLLFVSIVVSYLAMFVTQSVNQGINYTKNQTSNTSYVDVTGSVSSTSPSVSSRIGASWGLAGAVILIQLLGILTTPGCLTPLTIRGMVLPESVRAVGTAVIGAAIGTGAGAAFAGLSMTQPSYDVNTNATLNLPNKPPYVPGLLPTSTTQATGPGFVREQFQLGAGLGEMPMPPSSQNQVPVDMAKSSGAVTPGESSDQFVCEAYKNGQLVSSSLA
jgi:hypothetical protein